MTDRPEAPHAPSDQPIAENSSLYRAACEAAATALPAAVYDWAERVTLAVLRVALPMHETQHAGALRLAAERATHFELEAMRRAEERDAAIVRAEQAEAALAEARTELSESQRWFDALVTADKAQQGAADWMLNRLHNDKMIDGDTYNLLAGLLRDQINAKMCLRHPEDWTPLADRLRKALAELAEFKHEVQWAHQVVSVDGTWAGDEVVQADEQAAHASAGIVSRTIDPATDRVDVVCRDVWTRATDWRKADPDRKAH